MGGERRLTASAGSPIGGTYDDARRRWIEGERAYIPWLLEKSQQSMVRASVSAGIDP